MQLSRPSNMQCLAFSRFISVASLYLGPLIKLFFKTFLIIRRSPVTLSLWCLPAKGELLHLHGRLSGFLQNKSKSRKTLEDIDGVSL